MRIYWSDRSGNPAPRSIHDPHEIVIFIVLQRKEYLRASSPVLIDVPVVIYERGGKGQGPQPAEDKDRFRSSSVPSKYSISLLPRRGNISRVEKYFPNRSPEGYVPQEQTSLLCLFDNDPEIDLLSPGYLR